jgi:hypothetical protein
LGANEFSTKERTHMKNIIAVGLCLAVASLLFTPATHSQTASPGQASTPSSKDNQASVDQSVALLRQDLRSGKKQMIAANLKLTDAEATKFWPVYDQYSNEVSKLGDEKYALLKEYASGFGSLSDDQALSLTKRSLSLDEQLAQLRSKYVPIINRVLPGTKTATFFQIDRQLGMLIDVQMADQIPLVQEQK